MEPSISDFSNSPGSEAKPVSIDGNQSTPRLTIRFKVGQKTESQCQIRSRESVTSQFDQVAGVLGHYSCKLCLAQSDLSELTLKPMHPIMVSFCRFLSYFFQEYFPCFTDSDKIGLKDEHERRKDGCRGERKSTTLEKTTKHTQQEPVRALCTKKFPLLKAQFGRMRCHPKRDWRGIQPPEKPVLAKKNERNLQVKNSSNGAQMNSVESLSYHTNSTITEESSKEHYPLPPLSNWLVTGSGTRKNKTARSERNLEELGFLKKQETDKESLESDPKKSEILHESFLVYRRGQWKKKTEEKREARAIQTATNSGTPQEGEISSNCHDSKKRKLFIGGSAANNSEEEEVSQEDVQVSGIGSEISVAFLKALGGHMRKHFDRKKHLAKLKAHHSSKRLTMGSQVELGGERKNGEGERRNEERMGAMDLNGVKPIEDEDLKFAISMLEVVPAYAGYVRSRLFMIFEA
ncbi:hypothetical protein AMTR_s00090p00027440 [Amborella trichopoda]|uniref:Uncharacterized protein n=1 Tax=Amborella trichopoda TaxID=13333 RepID=W1P1U4_AMBTC|nr:hypothetical protein AMTR_s00090p00027440 [Amborella trichopoda]